MDDAVLAGLYGLRETPPTWLELLAALAIGLLLAGMISAAAYLFQGVTRPAMLDKRLEKIRLLPMPQRAIALASILKELTDAKVAGDVPWPERAAEAFGLEASQVEALADIYRSGPPLDAVALERAIRVAGRS